MELTINGEACDVKATTLVELLQDLGLASQQGVAVAVDGEVIPRSEWGGCHLVAGQTLEILHAVQGG